MSWCIRAAVCCWRSLFAAVAAVCLLLLLLLTPSLGVLQFVFLLYASPMSLSVFYFFFFCLVLSLIFAKLIHYIILVSRFFMHFFVSLFCLSAVLQLQQERQLRGGFAVRGETRGQRRPWRRITTSSSSSSSSNSSNNSNKRGDAPIAEAEAQAKAASAPAKAKRED